MEDKDKEYNKDSEDWRDEKRDEDSDDFGLPNVSYNPLDRQESSYSEELPHNEPEEKIEERYYNYEEKKGSQALAVVAFFIVFLGILGALYWFLIREEPTPEPVEQIPEEAFTPTEPLPSENEFTTPSDEPEEAAPVEEEPEPEPQMGSLHVVTGASSQYYIVMGSFIDDDLAKDYSARLNAQGLNTYLIEPYGANKFYRLGVGTFNTWGEAASRLQELKQTYGEQLWVLKY